MRQRSQKFGGCLSWQKRDFAPRGRAFGWRYFLRVFQREALYSNKLHEAVKVLRGLPRNASEFRQRIAVGLFLGKMCATLNPAITRSFSVGSSIASADLRRTRGQQSRSLFRPGGHSDLTCAKSDIPQQAGRRVVVSQSERGCSGNTLKTAPWL